MELADPADAHLVAREAQDRLDDAACPSCRAAPGADLAAAVPVGEAGVGRVAAHGRMDGSNAPLLRHKFGERDFDVNIDGVAHHGMLPDFLQDVANSHPNPAQVAMYFDPLFSSAEDCIQMWEKALEVR